MKPSVECVLDIKAKLGECPVWCPSTGSLYWIDIQAPSLNRFDPSPLRLQLDDEWIERLPQEQRLMTTAIALPLLRRYGYAVRG